MWLGSLSAEFEDKSISLPLTDVRTNKLQMKVFRYYSNGSQISTWVSVEVQYKYYYYMTKELTCLYLICGVHMP